MDTSFFDQPISSKHYFLNAPEAQTRREASQLFFSRKEFSEPSPPAASSESIIHQITHPASLNTIIDRQVILQNDDNKIRNPSAEFEHLVLERLPGITLEKAWPTLNLDEKTRIADQVVSLLGEVRKLHSINIKAALYLRKLLRGDVKNDADFIHERFRGFMDNEYIARYVEARIDRLDALPIVLTHGDLDWSNILVNDGKKQISGIIDWECSGYFPAYWEWATLKRFCPSNNNTDEDSDGDSWFKMLERRLRPSEHAQGKTAWELERLHKALGKFTQWALTLEARRMNRGRGWAEVCGILELDVDEYPAQPVDYATSSEHPWWLEDRHA
ncbi:Aminoglycoside phosphotransferase [Penicillium occitanis (nom. inval.)]|nr:Aminoglycoside phosphotransferase [Penicillium occitanis (nom. inval.)]PCH01937.1 hypothetical protein PENOC_045890 [Penicillium occitanis (nom. inval.)]